MAYKVCCVPKCYNIEARRYYIPSDEKVKDAWLERIGNSELFGKPRSKLRGYVVCDLHFIEECKINGKLKPFSLPVLNLPNYVCDDNSEVYLYPEQTPAHRRKVLRDFMSQGLIMNSENAFVSLGLYSPSSNVIDLTPSNFDELVIKGDEVWVVEFYAPWCAHCKNFAPEYEKVTNVLQGVVKVGAVNADDHKDLGSRFGVCVFPTVMIFGANKNKPEKYEQDHTANALVEAALAAVKNKVYAALGRGSSSSSNDNASDGIQWRSH